MKRIDINCDLGEGFDDAELMPLITSANIACGGHAGDQRSMRNAVQLAIEYGVNVGAHPSYEDRANFGRVAIDLPLNTLRKSIVSQIAALKLIAEGSAARLRHVKPHGALYNAAIHNELVTGAIVDAVLEVDPALAILTLPTGRLAERATACGLTVIAECFADRTYQADGTLTPRTDPRALHTREIDSADQILWIVRDGCARTIDGSWIPMQVQTVCIHGDGNKAISTLRMIRNALTAAGVEIRPF